MGSAQVIALIRAMLLLVAPWHPPIDAVKLRVLARAEAIAYATRDPRIRVELLVIDFYETTYGHAGVPWGACAHLCHRHCGSCRTDEKLPVTATWAASVLERAHRECGGSENAVLGYYHSGACHADAYSTMEASQVRTILRRWAR